MCFDEKGPQEDFLRLIGASAEDFAPVPEDLPVQMGYTYDKAQGLFFDSEGNIVEPYEPEEPPIEQGPNYEDLQQQVQTMSAAQAAFATSFMTMIADDRQSGTNAISDTMILAAAAIVDYPKYEDKTPYTKGQILENDGLYFEVKENHTSHAVAYPIKTTFAYYRHIELKAAGTLADPIPYPEGAGIVVSVIKGKYYGYKGGLYLAEADMPNCVWPPDTAMWQWKKIS